MYILEMYNRIREIKKKEAKEVIAHVK